MSIDHSANPLEAIPFPMETTEKGTVTFSFGARMDLRGAPGVEARGK